RRLRDCVGASDPSVRGGGECSDAVSSLNRRRSTTMRSSGRRDPGRAVLQIRSGREPHVWRTVEPLWRLDVCERQQQPDYHSKWFARPECALEWRLYRAELQPDPTAEVAVHLPV